MQPFQETYNNINDHFIKIKVVQRYDKHCDVYYTEPKGKYHDKTRQHGCGHKFQIYFAILCVKTIHVSRF